MSRSSSSSVWPEAASMRSTTGARRGFGSVRVRATIGSSTWTTSIFPASQAGYVLPVKRPVRVAEEWSVVDNLSGGRVGLSFASGWHANDFALMPGNYADRREIMARGIETIRKLFQHSFAGFGGVLPSRPIRQMQHREVSFRSVRAHVASASFVALTNYRTSPRQNRT